MKLSERLVQQITRKLEAQGKRRIDEQAAAESAKNGPRKKASPRCESGGKDFCTCDICF